jgi:hypothetical protein
VPTLTTPQPSHPWQHSLSSGSSSCMGTSKPDRWSWTSCEWLQNWYYNRERLTCA